MGLLLILWNQFSVWAKRETNEICSKMKINLMVLDVNGNYQYELVIVNFPISIH